MNENDTLVAPPHAKSRKSATPSNPFRIIPEEGRPGRWVVEMTYSCNGERSRIFCGSFASPEEAQKTWNMEEPTNRAELLAQGYDIKAAKKLKAIPEETFLVQSKTEKSQQGHPLYWSQELNAFGSKNKATAHIKKQIKNLPLPEGHEVIAVSKKRNAVRPAEPVG